MKEIDVLLVLPPMYQTGRVPDYNPKEPMGLMFMKSFLEKNGRSVEILDADILALTIDETVSEILKRPAKIIGFSVMQRALPSLKLLVEKLSKEKVNSHICCGGFAATLSCRHILEEISRVDSIVLGEGEVILLQLINLINESVDWKELPGVAFKKSGQVILNQPADKPNIESLPWPSRSLLPLCLEKTNYATILASRGCYGVCSFCSNQSFERSSSGANWRGRNPIDIVDEIDSLRKSHNVRVFKFNDPNLFGPGLSGRQHVVDICNEIISRKITDLHIMGFCRSNDIDLEIAQLMKKAGFERVLIGIESANPFILKLFRKGESLRTISQSIEVFKKVGISIVPGFMIFNPYTTIKTLETDIEFLEKYDFMPTLSKCLRIFDGTPLQEIMSSENRLVWRNPFEGYHEYLVDPSIAAIYMVLKTVSVEWTSMVFKSYQEEIWKIKKANGFKERAGFDSLSKSIFLLEKEMLKELISWSKSGVNYRSVVEQIKKLKRRLINIEQFIISTGSIKESVLDVQEFSVSDLSGRIYSILLNKVFRTFPEQYRWKND